MSLFLESASRDTHLLLDAAAPAWFRRREEASDDPAELDDSADLEFASAEPEAEELDEPLARFLGHHWEQVAHASGQPFDHSFLERRDGWRYDTETPAIAVVTMRELNEPATLRFHSRLQHAFYAEGVDITDTGTYPSLIDGFDVDTAKFIELVASDEMRQRAWQDFAEARSLGAGGFPTLVIRDGEEYGIITRGYVDADRLLPALSDWLLNKYAEAGEALFCEPGTVC